MHHPTAGQYPVAVQQKSHLFPLTSASSGRKPCLPACGSHRKHSHHFPLYVDPFTRFSTSSLPRFARSSLAVRRVFRTDRGTASVIHLLAYLTSSAFSPFPLFLVALLAVGARFSIENFSSKIWFRTAHGSLFYPRNLLKMLLWAVLFTLISCHSVTTPYGVPRHLAAGFGQFRAP